MGSVPTSFATLRVVSRPLVEPIQIRKLSFAYMSSLCKTSMKFEWYITIDIPCWDKNVNSFRKPNLRGEDHKSEKIGMQKKLKGSYRFSITLLNYRSGSYILLAVDQISYSGLKVTPEPISKATSLTAALSYRPR